MAAPITYELHMRELDEQLSEPDLENVENPLHKFLESREIAFAGGSAGVAAFQKIGKAPYRPPVDDTHANPWLVRHETVKSEQTEADWDEEIPRDRRTLEKRIGDSTRRLNIAEFIKRRLATGSTVEELADYAEKHDVETAQMIREIGATL